MSITTESTIKPLLSELIALRTYANTKILPQRKKANAASNSEHSGKPLGRGMDFTEFRHYQPGDDVRTIDWRVTARTGKAHIRVYCEERERPVFILVDQSQNMQFGTQIKFKAVLAAQIAAILAWSALQNKDRVGGIVTGINKEFTLLPRNGKYAVLHLLRLLTQDHEPSFVHWGNTLCQLRSLVKASSIICLISDFENFSPEANQHAQQLAKYNDVLFVYVSDPLEHNAPSAGRYLVSNGEQELVLNTGDKNFCKKYRESFQHQFNRVKQFCASSGINFISAMTNETIEHLIMKQR